jgi:CBS domain-containing protein
MRADEIMITPVITCQSNESLEQAARQMWDHDCGAIPIVNDKGTLVGMLTDRDICMAALHEGGALRDQPIHTAMSKAVFAATPDVTVKELEALMAAQQVRRIPIINAENKPIGILSINDLVRFAARSGGGNAKVIHALATISQPRPTAERAA